MSTEDLPEHSSLFPPSGYEYDIVCPPRVALRLQLAPDDTYNEKRERGSAMHDQGDNILQILLKSDITATKKKANVKKALAVLQDDTERDTVMKYVDNVIQFRNRALSQIKGNFVEFFEAKLSDSEDSSGTVDHGLLLIGKKVHIVVQDLKTGDWEVDAEQNKQLCRYVLMVLAQAPQNMEFAGAHIVIHQYPATDEPKVWFASPEFMLSFKKEFEEHKKNIYRLLKEGVALEDFVMGDHCDICDAKHICPVQQEKREKALAHIMKEPSMVPDVKTIDFSIIPIEKKVELHQASAMIKKILEANSKALLADGLAGKDLGEMEVVEGTTRRAWDTDDKTAAQIGKELRAMGVKKPTVTKVIAIGEVEKQLKALGGDTDISHLTKKPAPGPTLALKSAGKVKWSNGVKKEMLD